MMVSLEVVPRNQEALLSGVAHAGGFPQIQIINVPDLLRFPLRSWDACGILAETPAISRFTYMPHLRARDFDPQKPFPHTALFRARGITRVLVIAGDPPEGEDPAPPVPIQQKARGYSTKTVSFIKKLKAEMPELQIYAAFDPYRSNIRYELDYLRAKEDAGAVGFMSQPFFDLRLLEIFAEYLEGKQVFWGLSPVLSESSRNYWESRNRAVFPKNFRADLYWNVDFGRRVLRFCETQGFHLYLIPIKADVSAYLSGIFG
ncbi:MAG: methylenetetrahydrofolate reductase [Spirochaetaceae bacterium]|jgi:methylenetetrahydrofolate reductase (NADPH)|nr:methylenetetrahydrofolate reductase [Spirochaetaceae bacterium]